MKAANDCGCSQPTSTINIKIENNKTNIGFNRYALVIYGKSEKNKNHVKYDKAK
jgi:hypothetical protein